MTILKTPTDFEHLAGLLKRSPDEMQRAIDAAGPDHGSFRALAPEDGMEQCASYSVTTVGIDTDARLCAALVDGGVKYSIDLKIFGITVIQEAGILTPDHEEVSFSGNLKAVSGTLTIGVNQWSSHYCPFIRWQGKVKVGPFHKSFNVDHQFFCLR